MSLEQAWNSLGGAPLPVASAEASLAGPSDGMVSACARIRGGWNGAVFIHMNERLIRRVVMAVGGGGEVPFADEVAGELVRMVASRVAAVLPGVGELAGLGLGREMGRKCVCEMECLKKPELGLTAAWTMSFSCGGEPILVAVHGMEGREDRQ